MCGPLYQDVFYSRCVLVEIWHADLYGDMFLVNFVSMSGVKPYLFPRLRLCDVLDKTYQNASPMSPYRDVFFMNVKSGWCDVSCHGWLATMRRHCTHQAPVPQICACMYMCMYMHMCICTLCVNVYIKTWNLPRHRSLYKVCTENMISCVVRGIAFTEDLILYDYYNMHFAYVITWICRS